MKMLQFEKMRLSLAGAQNEMNRDEENFPEINAIDGYLSENCNNDLNLTLIASTALYFALDLSDYLLDCCLSFIKSW